MSTAHLFELNLRLFNHGNEGGSVPLSDLSPDDFCCLCYSI